MVTKKLTTFIITSLMTVLLASSCNNKPANIDRKLTEDERKSVENIVPLTKSDGIALLRQNCYNCHNPNSASHDDMLAPPLAGIKHRYLQAYNDQALFVRQMADFVHHPTEENALMKGPVRRFGLMPVTTLSQAQIEQVCLFIYQNELDVPSWFPEHFENNHGKSWNSKQKH